MDFVLCIVAFVTLLVITVASSIGFVFAAIVFGFKGGMGAFENLLDWLNAK